ncbi:condensin-2 complex subunit h2 [Limosa lapponica baueri]|uniref:Condensin-2 complex subunit H2 n=1 Tax=Limosa lapponica baueri TaxID=1758121 RepID=A0A2I0TBF3_LIMLA|nr:condensin-2 complex subunit h2 [Limosa lapponica baueri]
MEEVESRFLHLLQPIRDLTKNWEVDVAAQLGEYLEEVRGGPASLARGWEGPCRCGGLSVCAPHCPLDQICISFDDGKTTMNFIEAALVIQGSACVYSRKVEYLYSLVYQTLDFISNKKCPGLATILAGLCGDGGTRAGSVLLCHPPATLPLQAVDIVPLTPMSLVLPEEAEKRDNPLFR